MPCAASIERQSTPTSSKRPRARIQPRPGVRHNHAKGPPGCTDPRRTYVPSALADGLEAEVLERGSIYDEIERRHGLRVTRAQEIIRPTVLSRSLAGLLAVRKGSPVFLVERSTWAGSRAIEWHESIVRGDRFLYSVELRRPEAESGRPGLGTLNHLTRPRRAARLKDTKCTDK